MITITPRAAEQIRHSAKQGQMEGMPMRIAAQRADDGSIHYAMGFDDEIKDIDNTITSEGIELLVAPSSQKLLDGTIIDFVKLEDDEHGFIFMNPQDPNYTAPVED